MVARKKKGRPKNEEASATIEVSGAEPKLVAYLKDILKLQGFGNSTSAIARAFIWKEVNRLIESGRLKQR